MINVIVVPETKNFQLDVSHHLEVWINSKLGRPDIYGRNAKYVAPYWITEGFRGVDRIFHILNTEEHEDETTLLLGNSFVLKEAWDKMGNYRRFEYHPLEEFGLIEIKDGLLLQYEETRQNSMKIPKETTFNAISINTTGYKFNREEANER